MTLTPPADLGRAQRKLILVRAKLRSAMANLDTVQNILPEDNLTALMSREIKLGIRDLVSAIEALVPDIKTSAE